MGSSATNEAASEAEKIAAAVRKAFRHAEATCTEPWVLDYATNLPGTQLTLHQLLTILSGVACIASVVICTYLAVGHLLHWTRPKEQKQILRIIIFIPVYAILTFASVLFYLSSGFIAPFGQWWEGFALTALFLLYIEIATPDGPTRESFFDGLERRWYSGKRKGDGGSLRWFRSLNILVFQLFFARIATVLATELLYGLTCPLSITRAHGQTAISVLQGTSTGFAIWGCLAFEKRLHSVMHEHHALLKLASFKVVVALDGLQEIIFPTLAEHRIYQPSPPWRVSWNDFALVVPNFMLAMELVFVAVSFLWCFSFARYRNQLRDDLTRTKTPLRDVGAALRDVFNIVDIWEGVAYAFWGRVPSSWFKAEREQTISKDDLTPIEKIQQTENEA